MSSIESSYARVRVLPAKPTIVTEPASLTVSASSNVAFNVVAIGSEPLHYQWFFNDKLIPRATNAQLSISDVQAAGAGFYSVTVSNSLGKVTSLAAHLIVRPAAPYFVIQPTSTSLLAGSAATLSSQAAGTQPIRYQWHFQGRPLLKQANDQLVLSAVTPGSAGRYYVTAVNAYGAVASMVAQITVDVLPHLARPMASQIVQTGRNAP